MARFRGHLESETLRRHTRDFVQAHLSFRVPVRLVLDYSQHGWRVLFRHRADRAFGFHTKGYVPRSIPSIHNFRS